MNALFRGFILTSALIAGWELGVQISDSPPYILPSPLAVGKTLAQQYPLLLHHTLITAAELCLSLLIGITIGLSTATIMLFCDRLRALLMPLLVISQALPVFALAPLLLLWFGFGMAPKIIMAVLIIFFPVTINSFDGLRHTPQIWLDTARTLGASRWRIFYHVRFPAARVQIASGIRVALVSAPIGVIVGEWIGASQGLGFLMLHANARIETALMFAALLCLCLLALTLYVLGNHGLNRWCKRC